MDSDVAAEVERSLAAKAEHLSADQRAAFIDRLSARADLWGLELLELLPSGKRSVVVRSSTGETADCVLKMAFDPDSWYDARQCRNEASALRAWGPASARVIDSADDSLLLEWLPGAGQTPNGMDDLVATANALVRAATAAIDEIPPLQERVELSRLWARARQVPSHRRGPIETKLEELADLTAGTPGEYLLHGDLAPKNIALSSRPRWFDPIPHRGPLAFDLAYLAWSWAKLTPVSAASYWDALCETAPEHADDRWFLAIAVLWANNNEPLAEAMQTSGIPW